MAQDFALGCSANRTGLGLGAGCICILVAQSCALGHAAGLTGASLGAAGISEVMTLGRNGLGIGVAALPTGMGHMTISRTGSSLLGRNRISMVTDNGTFIVSKGQCNPAAMELAPEVTIILVGSHNRILSALIGRAHNRIVQAGAFPKVDTISDNGHRNRRNGRAIFRIGGLGDRRIGRIRRLRIHRRNVIGVSFPNSIQRSILGGGIQNLHRLNAIFNQRPTLEEITGFAGGGNGSRRQVGIIALDIVCTVVGLNRTAQRIIQHIAVIIRRVEIIHTVQIDVGLSQTPPDMAQAANTIGQRIDGEGINQLIPLGTTGQRPNQGTALGQPTGATVKHQRNHTVELPLFIGQAVALDEPINLSLVSDQLVPQFRISLFLRHRSLHILLDLIRRTPSTVADGIQAIRIQIGRARKTFELFDSCNQLFTGFHFLWHILRRIHRGICRCVYRRIRRCVCRRVCRRVHGSIRGRVFSRTCNGSPDKQAHHQRNHQTQAHEPFLHGSYSFSIVKFPPLELYQTHPCFSTIFANPPIVFLNIISVHKLYTFHKSSVFVTFRANSLDFM